MAPPDEPPVSLAEPEDSPGGLRTLLDRSPDMLFRLRLGPEPHFEFVSRAAEAITGHLPEAFVRDPDLAGRLIEEDATPDAVTGLLAMDPRLLPERMQVPIRRADGRRAWVEVDLAVHCDEAGEAVSIDGAVRDVTRRRETSDDAARLAALVDQADDAICTLDADGSVLTWNGGAERLTGIPAAEAIGRAGPFAVEAETVEVCRRVMGEGASVAIPDAELRTRDGSTIPVSLSVSPVRGPDGTVRAVLVVARDERARVQADRQLRFRDAILAAVDDAVIATDEDMALVYWSPGAERLFGVPAERAMGRLMEEVAPFRIIGATVADAVATLASGRPVRVDAEYRRPDGSTIVGETRATRMLGPGGAAVSLAVIRDVTAIREAALDSARLAAIVEGAGDIIVGTDLDGVVRSWNPAAERALGYRAEEMIGRTIATYIAPADLPRAFALRERLIVDGDPSAAAELTYVTRSGVAFPVWVVIAPIHGGDGDVTGISAIGSDLRARKSLEEQLRQAQKLEAVGRLAGGIAHDFNNLLTAIAGYASLLATEVPEDGAAAADVAQILLAAGRAGDLTRSLLAFSRGQPRESRVVALDAIVEGVGPLLHRLLPEAVDLVVDARSDVALLADPAELELVLVNLAVNGADAMPNGGRLEIGARAVNLDQAFADAHLGVSPGRHAELVVRDTGVGMTDEVRSHLFEPFFTTKHDRGGTGLGLTTVHAHVERAGGTIWVDTGPGRGTTFRILIPATDGIPAPALEAAPMHDSGGTERIVVVEDDAGVRALATMVLARAGYRLSVHADPVDAATLDPAEFDLLLSDVVMPHLAGPALAARLRGRRPGLPVLFMSGYMDPGDALDLARFSDQPLLAKPFGPRDLLAAVRRALDERT